MMSSFKNLKIGFTLIEVLIYISLFMVVTAASVGFLFSLDDFIYQYRIETALYKSGTNAMEQILLGVRQAESVDLINSTFNTPAAGRLTVINGASTTAFVLDSGVLRMELDGDDYGTVAFDGVNAEEFTVYYYTLTEGELVRVKLRLSATINGVTKDLTLYGSSVVRGSL